VTTLSPLGNRSFTPLASGPLLSASRTALQELTDCPESLRLRQQRYSVRVARLRDNVEKNRYSNIYPHDRNIVRLRNGGYTNGSRMRVGTSPKIALSAPPPHTFSDFWRLLIEQESPLIVMTANEMEKEIRKVDNYWNSRDLITSSLEGTGFSCADVSTEILFPAEKEGGPHIVLRRFTLVGSEGEERVLEQLHLSNWEDHGATSTELLLTLLKEIQHRTRLSPLKGSTFFHCSAGVGRTGVTIAVLSIIEELEEAFREGKTFEEIEFSIPDMINRMRADRKGMVQSHSQVKMIAECLELYLQRRENLSIRI